MNNGFSQWRQSRQNGFTLIEVMVAVAVIAIALPALLFSMMGQVENTGYMRDKMQAQWLADNKLTELRVRNQMDGAIPDKKFDGEEEFSGRTWLWETTTKEYKTDLVKNFYEVKIAIWLKDIDDDEKGDPLVSMQTYMLKGGKQPITRPAPPKS